MQHIFGLGLKLTHLFTIFNDGRSHLTCYIGDKFYRSYPAHSDVFCISIVGDRYAILTRTPWNGKSGLHSAVRVTAQPLLLESWDWGKAHHRFQDYLGKRNSKQMFYSPKQPRWSTCGQETMIQWSLSISLNPSSFLVMSTASCTE